MRQMGGWYVGGTLFSDSSGAVCAVCVLRCAVLGEQQVGRRGRAGQGSCANRVCVWRRRRGQGLVGGSWLCLCLCKAPPPATERKQTQVTSLVLPYRQYLYAAASSSSSSRSRSSQLIAAPSAPSAARLAGYSSYFLSSSKATAHNWLFSSQGPSPLCCCLINQDRRYVRRKVGACANPIHLSQQRRASVNPNVPLI